MARGFIRLPKGAPRYIDTPRMEPGGMTRYPWLEWAFAYNYSRHYPDSGWTTYDHPLCSGQKQKATVLIFSTSMITCRSNLSRALQCCHYCRTR